MNNINGGLRAPLEDISGVLAAARRNRGISASEACRLAGISRPALGKLESGPKTWRSDTVIRIAGACGYDAQLILTPCHDTSGNPTETAEAADLGEDRGTRA